MSQYLPCRHRSVHGTNWNSKDVFFLDYVSSGRGPTYQFVRVNTTIPVGRRNGSFGSVSEKTPTLPRRRRRTTSSRRSLIASENRKDVNASAELPIGFIFTERLARWKNNIDRSANRNKGRFEYADTALSVAFI